MIFPNKHNGYQADGSRQYHKGGDGGAKAARQQEEERQKRIQLAVDRINAIFDSKPYSSGVDKATAFDPNETYYTSTGDVWHAPRLPSTRVIVGQRDTNRYNGNRNIYQTIPGGYDMDAIKKAIQKGELYTGVENAMPESRQKLYDEQKQAVFDINKLDVERQYKDAERTNRFGLARSGLLGGSADVDSNAELQRKNNEGMIRAAGLGDQAAADLKTADERSRQSLISMAQSGTDIGSAQASALRNLDASAQSALSQRAGSSLSGLFDDLEKAGTRQYSANPNSGLSGYQLMFGNVGTRSGGSQGNVNQ